MGDDRHGQTPRPGGRAPWERMPAADIERESSTTGRRARHDAPQDAAPLTVQDLMDKVDNERTGRRRRGPEAPPPAPERGAPARSPESAARPRPAAPERAADERGPRRPAPTRTSTGSVVVDDIVGRTAAPPPPPRPGKRPAPAEPPEPVTDILPVTDPVPADEPDDSADAERRPATSRSGRSRGKAEPKPVGKPATRLAAGKQRRSRRLRIAGRFSAAGLAVVVLLVTGGGWSYMRSTNNAFTQVSALDDNPEDVVDSQAQLGDENYLIVGTDTRAGLNGQLGAGTLADAEGARADTVMLVHIPKNRKRVVAVSFPRDLDVTRPQCNGWDNDKGDYTKEVWPSAMGDKLNAVYALAGPKCLVNVIRKMTGLSISHFIGIDFAGFEAMVDKIEGVEVCVTKPLIDGVLGTIIENPGRQRVDGETALNYVRARHVYGEERSDYDRINRQQRFMSSLLRGAMSSKVLFDPGKLNDFITEFTKHTWVDQVNARDLLNLGRSLQKVEAGAVTFLTIPTAGTTSYGNEIPRESDIKAIFSAIRNDQPLPGEQTAEPESSDPSTSAPEPVTHIAVDPSTVSLLVSNGSGYTGAARSAAAKLGNQGFQIYNEGNYSLGQVQSTRIRYATGHEAEAATVASAIPGATLEVADDLGSIVEVVLGADSQGALTVRTPTPVGDPITESATAAVTESAPLPADLEHVNAGDQTCT